MNQTLTATAGQCRLETSVRQSGGSLIITYRFINNSSQNAYLFNRQYTSIGEDGVYKTRRDLANVETHASNVTVSKKIVPVPSNMLVEKRIVPCVTRVESGQHFEETVILALPLTPRTPYLKPDEPSLSEAVSMPLVFELGFFTAPPEGDALAQEVPTSEGQAFFFDPFPASSQSILRTGPFRGPVPVRPLRWRPDSKDI